MTHAGLANQCIRPLCHFSEFTDEGYFLPFFCTPVAHKTVKNALGFLLAIFGDIRRKSLSSQDWSLYGYELKSVWFWSANLQEKRDSNPQQKVLETYVLPIGTILLSCRKTRFYSISRFVFGAFYRIRTCDNQLRRLLLCPTELKMQALEKQQLPRSNYEGFPLRSLHFTCILIAGNDVSVLALFCCIFLLPTFEFARIFS